MKRRLLQLIVFTALLASCTQKEEPAYTTPKDEEVKINSKIEKDKFALDYSDALSVAQQFNEQQSLQNKSKKRSINLTTRAQEEYQVIMSESNTPIAYIVNFVPSGFCIISATKDTYPVLAYSSEGIFNLNETSDSPVSVWLDEMSVMSATATQMPDSIKDNIRDAWRRYEDTSTKETQTKYTNAEQLAAYTERRNYYGMQGIMVTTLDNPSSLPSSLYSQIKSLANYWQSPEEFTILIVNTTKSKRVGKLLETKWHQSVPYNSDMPIDEQGKHMPAGCSAVAAGQIMKYFKYPTNYDWLRMKYDDSCTSKFLHKLGISFNIKYTPSGSRTNGQSVVDGLINDFNYEAELTSHNLDRIKNDIINYRYPVCCAGVNNSNKAHMWVCDGYDENDTYYSVKVDLLIGTSYRLHSSEFKATQKDLDYVHYNWGAVKTETFDLNGWYISVSSKPINFKNTTQDISSYYINRKDIFMHPKP